MNAKAYLSRAYYLELQVKSKQEQIEALRSLAERVSPGFGGERVQHSPNMSAMEDTVAKILEKEKEIEQQIDELVEMKLEIARVIDRVEDVCTKVILEKRYLCFQSWMQIATELNYSERYTRTKHVEGLRAVEEILTE